MKRRGRPPRIRAEKPHRTLSSPEGTISFTLVRREGALYVERETLEPSGERRIVAALFKAPDEFLRWCEADKARFASPLMHSRVRKEGLDLLARIALASTAA